MQIRVAGTHLDCNRRTVAGELAVRHVEPVIGLRGRFLVVQAEHHELHVHLVIATFSLYAVFTAFQLRIDN